MKVLRTILGEEETCVYLPDRLARSEYRIVAELSASEYEALMERGWRKFGAALHKPVCAGCSECRSLRVETENFVPSRSQRRTLQKNSDLSVIFTPPYLDDERLALYHRYHAAQEVEKGWPGVSKTPQDYYYSFVHNPVPAMEIAVRDPEGVLRAVVLTDVTENIVSGVYHYHDPDWRERGVGAFAMLQTIELARRMARKWVYFGYWVAGCPSLAYKANFGPHEVLGDDGVWRSPHPV